MEGKKEGIFRLFMIIIFFCFSILFLNNNKKNFATATHIDICNIKGDSGTALSSEHVYQEMKSLFYTHDIDLIVKTMSQFKYNFTYDLIEKMVCDDTTPLSAEEKSKIMYGMIAHYACSQRSKQDDFFDLFLKYSDLQTPTPLLLSLARSKHPDIITTFIAWGKERQKLSNEHGLLADYAEKAFRAAVEDNDYVAVETLFSKKIRISSAKASDLLWHIIQRGKSSKLISLFVDHAQADINYTYQGKTLLIEAVEKNNLDTVRVLLDKGAVVDRIIDNEMITALTIATTHNYRSIERLLREYGA